LQLDEEIEGVSESAQHRTLCCSLLAAQPSAVPAKDAPKAMACSPLAHESLLQIKFASYEQPVAMASSF
jgi:hypothetical protein